MDPFFIIVLLTVLTLLIIYKYVPIETVYNRGNYGGTPPPPTYPKQAPGPAAPPSTPGEVGEEGEEGEEGEDDEEDGEVEVEGELDTEALEDGSEDTGETSQSLRRKFLNATNGRHFVFGSKPGVHFGTGSRKLARTSIPVARKLVQIGVLKDTRLCLPKTSPMWKKLGVNPANLTPSNINASNLRPLKTTRGYKRKGAAHFNKAARFGTSNATGENMVCTSKPLNAKQLTQVQKQLKSFRLKHFKSKHV